MARHGNRGPLTAVLEKGDWVLIRNLLERGRTGKWDLSGKTKCMWL